ncbi:MAG: DUF5115 domain-containing protein [Bacteroidales bacterium]|nr:DUF5115 domain-containing protein [Bacteroidales bacterium]
MKKTYIYAGLLASAMTMVSCDEDYKDWAEPQHYEQEGLMAATQGSLANVAGVIDEAAAESVIELAKANTNYGSAKFVSLKMGETDVPFSCDGNALVVKTADLHNIVRDAFSSLAETTREVELTAAIASYDEDGQAIATPMADNKIKLSYKTAKLPSNASEEAYYYVGGYNGWNLASPTKFTDEGDGVYTLTITIGDGEWFAFAPQSAVEDEDWNALFRAPSNGCTDNFGYLDSDQASGFSFQCEKGGTYRFVLDMKNYTYKYQVAPASNYFVTGSPNGWSDSVKNCAFYPQSRTVQSYTARWTGAWDLKVWSADNFSNWDACLGTVVDGEGAASGSLIASGANAFQSPEAGYYTLTVDFDALTYTWTKLENQEPATYEHISISGDFNGWGDTELARVSDDNNHNWYVLGQAVTAGGIKFKANLDWATNWGTSVNIAEQNFGAGVNDGDNITIVDGTYDIYFNDITGQFVFIKAEL